MSHYTVSSGEPHEIVALNELHTGQNKMVPEKVEDYCRAMLANVAVPPIDIDASGNILDGNHRFVASSVLGFTHIPAKRRRGVQRTVALDKNGLPTRQVLIDAL